MRKNKLLLLLALLLTAATGAWAETNLSQVMAAYTAQNGETLTGTLGENVKISIADGATVTLDGVTINGTNDEDYGWAGITCLGDATIILKGANTVKGFYEDYPGIYVPGNKTLTIQGTGSLDASSNGYGAGIGGGYNSNCGNIVISGGTITATGGYLATGIGGGGNGSCGAITIANTVTKVVAIKYEQNTPRSIGSGAGGSCGTVTIGGTVYADGIADSPYTYPTYTVSMKDGVKDADKWTITPNEGLKEGDKVTLQYTGRLKVKGVKATSDAPAKPAATVTTAPTATTGDIVAGSETALVSGGTATGGTMMYKVTTANTKPTSTEGFSDAVPTAKTLEAGTYYVWYYVKADADHANSEISATAIAVTVKAVEGHALSAAAVGEIVGSDGKAYAAANKDNLPEGVEAVAMIWYVNGTHGLALALADEADDDNIMYNWETANTLCNAHTPAITGATWKLATQDDWNNMITGAGGAAALRDGFSSVVGENLQNSPYWSSTNYKWDGYAMHYKFNDFNWEDNGKENDDFVRACLSW